MMNGIIVKEASTEKEKKLFVTFPQLLYKDCDKYVPPLINEELSIFDKNQNPVFAHAWLKLLVAYKDDKIVGRIAVLYNGNETVIQKIQKMRFGWFDCINDERVCKALFDEVEKFARAKNLSIIEGPMGFSNMDKTGMLTFGFDQKATMISSYNYDYYPKLLQNLGYKAEKEWIEFYYTVPKEISKIEKLATMVEKRYHLKAKIFKNKKDIQPFVNELFKLINGTYNQLSTYVPLSEKQAAYYQKKYMTLINPEYIKCVVNAENQLVGFGIISPSYATALQKAKGKLFPYGWCHLLKAQRNNANGELILIGILPEYRAQGVAAIIFREIYSLIQKIGIKRMETNPLLADNIDSIALWQQFNPTLHRKRNTFIKYL